MLDRRQAASGRHQPGWRRHWRHWRLRQLLVLGATAVIQRAKPGRPAASPWLLNLLARKPRKQHRANPVSRRLAAIPGIGPIGALNLALRVFERYQRSEKALVGSLAEMYVQGVSTRKVKAVTEALCGHSFSASSISAINKSLDDSLKAFAERRLGESYPYLILDARYEKVREAGVVASQAVLVAVAVNEDGRRQILAVERANRESRSSWRDFLVGLKARGLAGVEFVVSDDHPGLKQAIREVLPEAAWQRCYVHFLRNALDYVPRRVDDDCLRELRWFYDRREITEVRRDIAQWLGKWQAKYPRLCNWVEDNIEETLTYYRLPLPHHKHMKSTNMLERLNQELKRRTHVVRIFPNAESCLRLVRALAVEMHENWLEATRYLNMDHLKEHKKEALRALAA